MNDSRPNYPHIKPLAKWQALVAEHFNLPEVLQMHYSGAKEYLNRLGIEMLFANTVKAYDRTNVYVAVIEFEGEWFAFVTEAAGAWRRGIERFNILMTGREQIEKVMRLGQWDGGAIRQQDARLIGAAAVFTRRHGQVKES